MGGTRWAPGATQGLGLGTKKRATGLSPDGLRGGGKLLNEGDCADNRGVRLDDFRVAQGMGFDELRANRSWPLA